MSLNEILFKTQQRNKRGQILKNKIFYAFLQFLCGVCNVLKSKENHYVISSFALKEQQQLIPVMGKSHNFTNSDIYEYAVNVCPFVFESVKKFI